MSDRAAARVEPTGRALGLAAILHIGFVLTGMVTTLLGPILPILSARWSLADSQAGYFFTSQFAGSMAGVGLSSILSPRFGHKRSLCFGFGLMSLGIATIGLSSWQAGLVAVLCYGVGLGLVIPTTNLLVSDLNPARRAAALSILNMAWGAGAVASPALVALAITAHRILIFFPALGGLLAIVVMGIASNSCPAPNGPPPPLRPKQSGSLWRGRFERDLALLFLLYVGTENALSGWVAAYAKRLTPTAGAAWALAPSFFWGALLAGRAAAPVILRRLADFRLMVLGLLTALLGVSIVLSARTMAVVVLGVSLSGLGLASIFPIAVAALSASYGASATRIAGLMFALGGAGGATFPWLVGFLSTRFGSLRLGLGVPLFTVLAMLALQFSNPLAEAIRHLARPAEPSSLR